MGILIEVLAVASLTNYFVNSAMFSYFLYGVGLVVVGLVFLAKSVPMFIPLKQQKSETMVCPNCGAILAEDATVCEKCKQQLV